MTKRLKRHGRRSMIGAALLAAFLGGASLDSTGAARAAEQTPARHIEVAAQFEFQRVLEVVRDHRPGTNDSWRQTLAQAIVDESRSAGVDPMFAASIVARESSFRSRIVSHAGAVGLMQLRPWVARDLANRSEIEWQGLRTLHSPNLNVRLGLRYYKELVDRFGDERTALTAYCYGPTRVSIQLREGTYVGSRYATEILALYERLNTASAT